MCGSATISCRLIGRTLAFEAGDAGSRPAENTNKNNILCDIQIGKERDFESCEVYPDCRFEPYSHN